MGVNTFNRHCISTSSRCLNLLKNTSHYQDHTLYITFHTIYPNKLTLHLEVCSNILPTEDKSDEVKCIYLSYTLPGRCSSWTSPGGGGQCLQQGLCSIIWTRGAAASAPGWRVPLGLQPNTSSINLRSLRRERAENKAKMRMEAAVWTMERNSFAQY